MKGITEPQKQVLAHIYDYWEENKFPPTYRDLQERMNFKAVRTVECHLMPLEKKGVIVRQEGIGRSIRLTERGLAILGKQYSIPVISTSADCNCRKIIESVLTGAADAEVLRGKENNARYIHKLRVKILNAIEECHS